MTTLQERLRDISQNMIHEEGGYISLQDLCKVAADEIDRLLEMMDKSIPVLEQATKKLNSMEDEIRLLNDEIYNLREEMHGQ